MSRRSNTAPPPLDALRAEWRPFRPQFGPEEPLWGGLLAVLRGEEDERVASLEDLAAWAKDQSPVPLRFAATAMILRDLLQLGWDVRLAGEEIFVRPHDASDGQATKEAVKRQLHFGRSDQLRDAKVQRFILGLESPSRGTSHGSILSLIADGPSLAAKLRPIAALPRAQRPEALRRVCRPYLQLVESGQRDLYTGIPLNEVWRYFRYTWSSRYRRTPGRAMFFLIRDGAQPNHPVMGITALSNAVLQLSPRDEWIGWTADGLAALVASGEVSDAEALGALRTRIDGDLRGLYTEDLGFDGAAPPELTDALRTRLQEVLQSATMERAVRLREGTGDDLGKSADLTPEVLSAAILDPLFRAKRASAALALLEVRGALARAVPPLRAAAADPGVSRAVNLALRQIKQWYAAGSIMELTTCGAAPPYGLLLGGKLASFMMLSPSVRRSYRRQYEAEASIIASKMAGRKVTKDARLVLLGTTSLYPERSSQYNRLKVPPGIVSPHGAEFLEIGRSKGHGASNLSTETEAYLAAMAREQRDFDNVNFIFGEGQSPKMRLIREGLAALGLGAADLIRHASPRIIYLAPLVPNVRRVLLGLDEPEAPAEDDGADEKVADFWRTRWLASRLDHAPALQALEASPRHDSSVSRLLFGGAVQVPLFL
jgi:hypothetical protein